MKNKNFNNNFSFVVIKNSNLDCLIIENNIVTAKEKFHFI